MIKLTEFKDEIAKTLFGRNLSESKEKGVCVVCGNDITGFRDELSEKEYWISGLCQVCQDATFEGDEA